MNERPRGEMRDQKMAAKYTLPPDNVIALDENSEIRQKKKDYFLGLADEGMNWPVEIQGGGQSDYEKREFKIHYPVGDVFLSTAVTIHELGHLRQGEIDKRFAAEVLGAPETSIMGELEYHRETEEDAWQRGLARVKQYCPEFLQKIELKFKRHKETGQLDEFESFGSFFDHVVKMGLRVTELSDQAEQEVGNVDDERQKGHILARYLKSDEIVNTFFSQPKKWRFGEMIDRKEMESFIRRMAEKVAEEEYPI